MSELFTFSCTLLQKGFQLIKPPGSIVPTDNKLISYLDMDNPNEPDLDSEDIIYVVEQHPKELGDVIEVPFDGWNTTINGKEWEQPVLESFAFLVRKPQPVGTGIYVPDGYGDNYIHEQFEEYNYEDVANVAKSLYEKCLSKIAKKQCEYDNAIAIDLLKCNGGHNLYNPLTAPYINITLLTEWSAWSSQDYWGEWDGGIEMDSILDF